MDYGQDLLFGVFASPEAARVADTLELAQVADVAGLDLFTVQDHPYNATHADTSTLLTAVAARTSSIRVAANVANLPLRPPVVLAKQVATLDLLSNGRAELGLGTGAFWDAIEAAGGQRRTPGEAVDALVEAIRVIRGVWGQDPQRPGARSVTVEGEHYSVRGLRAGPAPAHDVEIWLGAYKPRMLRVTARYADGWLPSQGYADPAALPELSARLDEAALKAGRGPELIRRLYNVFGRFGTGAGFLQGTPRDWAEQLAELTLETGTSAFILGTDSPDDVRRFAEEVAPAARELVGVERARRAATTGSGGVSGGDAGVSGGDASVSGDDAGVPTRPGGAFPLAVRPTPDDGTRLSASLPWREDDRPSLPTPAEATYTAPQQAHPQHLLEIHDALRSELGRVRDVVDQVRDGLMSVGRARSVINTMAMRQNNWTLGAFCQSYCRIVTGHHTLEDRSVFTHLRHADPALGPVLDRLEDEHHVIADVLDQVDEALVALAGEEGYGAAGLAALDELQRTIDLLTDTLLSHLAYEERELFHPLAQHGLN
ncbi:5,10-methylene tetrahydromethanopterin reductase [Intrasporangium chromatireducens Q5-1]|uniref:5,10-methylene tetrahydromethanopterin reductase n=1 Tax=Intrasporangium chromatireducens Q5-1 TaxID=584657 RepID=W9GKJ3_9MICO|nr:LLM class flavin-dependent oxidoreductase [Intrasporangium chromatireducens]EWT05637.1 5,10-methylene tetrahydromethanopterin reductase [Intrasporangium chromatireducens Q5-1]